MLRPAIVLVIVLFLAKFACGEEGCYDLPQDAKSPLGKDYLIRCCPGGTSFIVNGDVVSFTKVTDARCSPDSSEIIIRSEIRWGIIVIIVLCVLAIVGILIGGSFYVRQWRQRRQLRRFSDYSLYDSWSRVRRLRRWLHLPVRVPPQAAPPSVANSPPPVERCNSFAVQTATIPGGAACVRPESSDHPLVLLRTRSLVNLQEESLFDEEELAATNPFRIGELSVQGPSLSEVYGDTCPAVEAAGHVSSVGTGDNSSEVSHSSASPSCFQFEL